MGQVRVGIVGLGAIGRKLAKELHAGIGRPDACLCGCR